MQSPTASNSWHPNKRAALQLPGPDLMCSFKNLNPPYFSRCIAISILLSLCAPVFLFCDRADVLTGVVLYEQTNSGEGHLYLSDGVDILKRYRPAANVRIHLSTEMHFAPVLDLQGLSEQKIAERVSQYLEKVDPKTFSTPDPIATDKNGCFRDLISIPPGVTVLSFYEVELPNGRSFRGAFLRRETQPEVIIIIPADAMANSGFRFGDPVDFLEPCT